MWIYLIIIFSIYFVGLLLLIMGWQRVGQSRKVSFAQPFASVVVAVRNETDTLPALLESLAKQSFSFTNFEVILIDDHSRDRTAEVIAKLMDKYPHLKIGTRQSNGIGKKQALTTGIEIARGEIILTTDADCQVPVNWIKDMIESYNPSTHMFV